MNYKSMTKEQLIAVLEEITGYKKNVTKISSSQDVFSVVLPYIENWKQEHLIALFLDGANHILGVEAIFKGTLNSCVVHPREIFKKAISLGAASIIISHNHPAGQTAPSREDIAITKRIQDAGKIVGIELLDHVIFTAQNFYSFKSEGLI